MTTTPAAITAAIEEAAKLGAQRAHQDIAAIRAEFDTPAETLEALRSTTGPLSGEWAGDPTPHTLAQDLLGAYYASDYPEDPADDIADAYEGAYDDTIAAAIDALEAPTE